MCLALEALNCCQCLGRSPKIAHPRLQLIDRIEKRVQNLIGQLLTNELLPLVVKRDDASLSLFYRYYLDKFAALSLAQALLVDVQDENLL